jgi:peptide-methionine (S)-S-oxide reductase
MRSLRFNSMQTRHQAVSWNSFFQFFVVAIVIAAEGQSIMAEPKRSPRDTSKPAEKGAEADSEHLEKATFGSGCFWCTEAVFQQLKGVKSCVSGYSGGRTKNPTYAEVCTGTTGHAEVIQVTFDPKVVSYVELLEVFWKTHDPTTLNRQGADHGTQYRSVIFYHDEAQQKLANEYLKKLDASGAFDDPIVTEISPLKEFYPGEDYHQNYFRDNPEAPYCNAVIKKKVAKFRAVFKDKLKDKH